MAGEDTTEDRTEAATPRRIQKARQQGQVALSREVVMLASLAGGTAGLILTLPGPLEEMLRALRGALERSHALPAGGAAVALLGAALWPVAAVAGLAALGAVAATLAQTWGLISTSGMRPQFARISPLSGAKRLFGPENLAEFTRTLLKLCVVGGVLWWALGDLAQLQAALQLSAAGLLRACSDAALRLMGAALGAFAAIAVLDLAWTRFRFLRGLRMTRQELRDEMKETEGNPQVKGRLRQIREQRARKRMMAAVPKAAVVVTNPTHYAVALAYDAGSAAAPRIVAKGADAVAARIRAMAEEHRVPVVPNPPLARALYRLELDTEIPAEHYQAVAEIIAYVWRLRGRTSAARGA